MILTAALCWWNERPDDLRRCVTAAAQIVDRIVALDGAYRRYPGATPASDPEQARTIRETAEAHGIECLIVTPDRLWAGQVEKRSHLLNLASIDADWILALDTDHVLHVGDREAVREELVWEHGMDVFEVPFYTPADPSRPIAESAANYWHIEQAEIIAMTPIFYRALPGFRVEKFHWWYSAIKHGERVFLWGGDGRYPSEPHSRFRSFCQIEHRCLLRDKPYIQASKAFLDDREMVVRLTGQEDHQDGLPAPLWVTA